MMNVQTNLRTYKKSPRTLKGPGSRGSKNAALGGPATIQPMDWSRARERNLVKTL